MRTGLRTGECGPLELREARFGQAGELADNLIDGVAQEPPGISVGTDGDFQITAQLSSDSTLLFQIH